MAMRPHSLLWQSARGHALAINSGDKPLMTSLKLLPSHLVAATVIHLETSMLVDYIDMKHGLASLINEMPMESSQALVIRVMAENGNLHLPNDISTFLQDELESLKRMLRQDPHRLWAICCLGIDFGYTESTWKLLRAPDNDRMVFRSFRDPFLYLSFAFMHYNEKFKPYVLPPIPVELKNYVNSPQNIYHVSSHQQSKELILDKDTKDFCVETPEDHFFLQLSKAGNAFFQGRLHITVLLLMMALLKGRVLKDPKRHTWCCFQSFEWLGLALSKLHVSLDVTLNCLEKMKSYIQFPFDETIWLITQQNVRINYGLYDEAEKLSQNILKECFIPCESVYYRKFWENWIRTIFYKVEDDLLRLGLNRIYHIQCQKVCNNREVSLLMRNLTKSLNILKQQMHTCLSQTTDKIYETYFLSQITFVDMFLALVEYFNPQYPTPSTSSLECVYHNMLSHTINYPSKHAKLIRQLVFVLSKHSNNPVAYKTVYKKFTTFWDQIDNKIGLVNSHMTAYQKYTLLVANICPESLVDMELVQDCLKSLTEMSNGRNYRIDLIKQLLDLKTSANSTLHCNMNDLEKRAYNNKYLNTLPTTHAHAPCTHALNNGALMLHYIKVEPQVLPAILSFGLETFKRIPRL